MRYVATIQSATVPSRGSEEKRIRICLQAWSNIQEISLKSIDTCKVQPHIACQRGTSGKRIELDGGSETVAGRRHGIMQHHATSCDIAQRVRRAEQPEGIVEWREMQWCNQRMRQSGRRLAVWPERAALQQKM